MLSTVILSIVSFLQQIKYGYLYMALGLYLILLWLTYSIWLWMDTDRRFPNLFIRIGIWFFATVTFVFGLLLYLLVRQPKSDDETHWLEIERRYLEYESYGVGECKVCNYMLRPEFMICPSCGDVLRERCKVCARVVDINWKLCPFCGTQHIAEEVSPAVKEKKRWFSLKPVIRMYHYIIKQKTKDKAKTKKKTTVHYPAWAKPLLGMRELFVVKEKASREAEHI